MVNISFSFYRAMGVTATEKKHIIFQHFYFSFIRTRSNTDSHYSFHETAVDLASVVDRAMWRREGWNDGNISFQSTLSRKMLLPAEVVDRASSSISIKERECR